MTPANNFTKHVIFNGILYKKSAVLLVILFSDLWCQARCVAQEVDKNAASTLPSAYKIIIRVVRPVWSAETLRSTARPRALPGNLFHFANPDSDTQFLQQFRKENPSFSVDNVRVKRALTLPTDKEWQIPGDVTYQKLGLGIFVKNKDLLANHLAPLGTMVLAGGKVSNVNNHPLKYKVDMTDRQLNQVRQSGKIMLCYYIQQYFPDAQGLKQYMQSDLIQFMQPGDTACLGTVLAVLDVPVEQTPSVAGKPHPTKPVLIPTDLVFVTIAK